ncbi:calcium-binding protein [Phaeovulum vinaykumarii]|uniref:Hemolysin-type calcium-binding repeat-containing protein n=1 Tax=Phaeovulum vinaykumarii TaxID=407234 RepID=A0A1N7MKZ8_9RHOB|nr:calcium-binding protein [Phaeovulum vinaykumarii]SIS86773.1 Hemolysin-type calcium-binding repeat-containing protein [Phaeovulum vinaykumarii]SOC13428.1 hemolysin type calcium-binding protein [Phaeovulum vinaykumarii]
MIGLMTLFSLAMLGGLATLFDTSDDDGGSSHTSDGEEMNGTAGNDTLEGSKGDDTIAGGDGDDMVEAGDGNDIIYDSAGADLLEGGAGNDVIVDDGGASTIHGGDGNDTIFASDDPDDGDGADRIGGENGDDVIYGDDGDTLWGGAGNDIFGVDMDDYNNPDARSVVVADYVKGEDQLFIDYDPAMHSGAVTLELAANGKDTLVKMDDQVAFILQSRQLEEVSIDDISAMPYMPDDINEITGTAGNDTLTGGAGADAIVALGGNDSIVDTQGDNIIDAGDGADTITTGTGDDVVAAGAGDDVVQDGDGDDVTRLGGGNDIYSTLPTDTGNDVVQGGTGNDTLTSGAGDDTLTGDDGNDTLADDAGQNWLDGGPGNDTLSASDDPTAAAAPDVLLGGAGDDVIAGDYGDQMTGGEGADTFALSVTAASASGTWSHITDYTAGTDTIEISYDATSYQPDVTVEWTPSGGGTLVRLDGAPAVVLTGVAPDEVNLSDITLVPVGVAPNPVGQTLTGTAGDDALTGGAGNDTITGGAGNDTLDGYWGDDLITDDAGNDLVYLGEGNDTYDGTTGSGSDTIFGGDGNDTITDVNTGAPTAESIALNGDDGADVLIQQDGNATLMGGSGDDTLAGDDSLDGAPDVLSGGPGADVIYGDHGDYIWGGLDADAYVVSYTANSGSDAWVHVQDYDATEDGVIVVYDETAYPTTPVLSFAASADGLSTLVQANGATVAILTGVQPDAVATNRVFAMSETALASATPALANLV